MKSLVSPYALYAEHRLQVPFHDVDSARVVWHGHYFKYFELARCELLDRIGYNYDQMMNSGYLWPIVDTQSRFLKPLFFNQNVVVAAALMEWELKLVIHYEIRDEAETVHCRARTTQVPLDASNYELVIGTPRILSEKMERFLASEN